MAIPSSYTEATLASYMQTVLQDVGLALGWTTTPDDYQNAVDESLLLMEVDDIADISGRASLRQLRAAARITVWSQVAAATAGDYKFSADGGSYDRHQVHEHALAMKAQAESDAYALGVGASWTVGQDRLKHVQDPYEYHTDAERTYSP